MEGMIAAARDRPRSRPRDRRGWRASVRPPHPPDVDVGPGVDDDGAARPRPWPPPRWRSPAASPPAPRCGAGRPARREHAQHVAVEFVHPVIVGKRALPAVAVTAGGRGAPTRCAPLVRAGDVLLVVGPDADDAGRRRRCCAGRGLGAHHRLARGRRPARRRARPTTCSGWATTPRWPATTAARARLPPALGADPRVLRAPRPAAGDAAAERGPGRAPPARTRAGWPRSSTRAADGATVRTATGRRGDRHHAWSATSTPATSCSSTPAPRSPWSRRRDRLPLPVHRGRRARRRGRCSPTSPARPRPRRRESRDLRADTLDRRGRELIAAAAAAMADRFAAGGRLFAFGNGGSATDAAGVARAVRPPAGGRAAAGPLAGRRPGGAHRARQRRGLRARVLPPADRLRPTRRHRPRPVDQRQLGEPPRGLRRGPAPGPAHGRPGRLRRRAHGRRRATSTTASWCAPTASTASRRRRRRGASPSGRACSGRSRPTAWRPA